MRRMRLDIHNYDLKYRQAEAQVRESEISDRNKSLILDYAQACLTLNVCGKVRLIRVFGVLLLLARHANKHFDALSRDDVQRIVEVLVNRDPPYSAETLGTYKAILRRFMTWVVAPDTFPSAPPPPIVSWLTAHVKAKDKVRLTRQELLTPQDVQRVLDTCSHPRDRALISMLWETGCRIAEIGNLQLQHVTRTDHGYLLDVMGKTGQRTPMIISSAPALTQWLNQHPFRNDPAAPLWVHWHHTHQAKHLQYSSIRNLLKSHFSMAQIGKRVYPHLFRHSRATYVLATGLMTEAQAKKYFGWTPNTDQLATYSHLVDADANNAILRENNLTPKKEVAEELKAQSCHRCQTMNEADAKFCTNCNAILDLNTAYEHQQVHNAKEELFASMFKLLVERGLVDDAARAVHEHGLGSTLKSLAEHVKRSAQPPSFSSDRPDDRTQASPPASPADIERWEGITGRD